MDKKSTNTYSGISKPVLKSLNRNYIPEIIKDENRISEIISEFVTGELNTIDSILNSNQILNFKDQSNQTLIHAILRNESPNIREEIKLGIIQKLVSDKNVSLHTMTNYNQNPLHLACQKGYSTIINYLIKNNCDQTLIDNYGNAPVHYLIDKFIRNCGDDDFYSQLNKQVKLVNSDELQKINKILKNESILILYELLGEKTIGSSKYYCKEVGMDGEKIISALKMFIKNKVQNSLPYIYDLIDKKIIEINKIFIESSISEEVKFEKAKSVVFAINNDIFENYKLDFDFKNIVWNNFLSQQKLQIKNKKDELKKNIFKLIEEIKLLNQSNIINRIQTEFVQNIYTQLSKFGVGISFIFYFLATFVNVDNIAGFEVYLFNNKVNGKLNYLNVDLSSNKTKKERDKYTTIMNKIYCLITRLFEKDFKVFLDGIEDINNLNFITGYDIKFLDDSNFAYQFCYDDKKLHCDDYIKLVEGKYNYNSKDIYIFHIPTYLESNNKNNYLNILHNEINIVKNKDINENQITKLLYQILGVNVHNIYSSIRILINVIYLINNKIINIKLDNLVNSYDKNFDNLIQKFCLFDIKYLSEYIFKIINNLVILEKYFDNIDIKVLEIMNKDFLKIFNDLTTSKDLNDNFKSIMKNFELIVSQSLFSEEFIKNLRTKKYSEVFNFLYDHNTNVIDKLKKIIENTNEYNSYVQLEKYNEFLEQIVKSPNEKPNEIKISNNQFNNYSFNLKYPPKYSEYKNNFFKIKDEINLYELGKKNIIPKLEEFITNSNYKQDFISKCWDYKNTNNFNIFYLDTTQTGSNYNLNIDYYNIIVDKTNIFNQFKVQQLNYNLKNYLFDGSEFKFSRGYDLLKYDVSGNFNDMTDVKGKDEKNILCDMKFISSNSDSDSSNISVKENGDKIVSWKIVDELGIKNIDDLNTWTITNKLSELVNMLVYMIYEKLSKSDVSDVFFKKKDLEFVNKNDLADSRSENMGIDLDYDGLDEESKTNITDTLGFIQVNPDQRQQYLYDNIKSFVKILLYEEINKEIFKIMDEIKITNLSKDVSGVIEEKQPILDEKKINEFNGGLKQMNKKYRENFLSTKLINFIKELGTSTTLNYQSILNLSKDFKTSTDDKIIRTKCLNKNKTDELMVVDMNYKVLDTNGNSILTRLIEQFNIYGIEKLIEKNKTILFTYKNNNMETPLEYLIRSLKNIQLDYSVDGFKYRMEKYSIILENAIKSNEQFDGIELSNSSNLVSNIILNSIYLFNSYMWLQNYSYPSGWDIFDKNNLKSLLGFGEEKLLINSIDPIDLSNQYVLEIKASSGTKISTYIKILEDEIKELESKSKGFEMESENKFITTNYDISGNLMEINRKIKEKNQIITEYKKLETNINVDVYDSHKADIIKILNTYKDKLLDINYLSIDWGEYTKLLNELDEKYLGIIKILDTECEKLSSINNHLIKIYCWDIREKENYDSVKKYFKLIFTKTFNDYWDLDRYDDSNYNITNKSIIQILKINVVGIIKNEFINTLTNYIIQLNKNIKNANTIINDIKTSEGLKNSIKIYLYECMINKIGLNNPNKSNLQINIDNQKNIIINILEKILGYKFDESEQNEIKKIIEFNKYLCENIGTNCYEEIIKILDDGKKISMYYKMYDLINNKIK
jgi:hypothetical protein